jgi:hypothetical protein
VNIILAALFIISAVITLLWPSTTSPGVFRYAYSNENIISSVNFSDIPSSIVNEANQLAKSFHPDSVEKQETFVAGLLTTYKLAVDRNVILIFNPGGYGWAGLMDSSGWDTIFDGIIDKLQELGNSILPLTYQRTAHGFFGIWSEAQVNMGIYNDKSKELAAKVLFLSNHLPHIKIILTGESNGSVICDEVLFLLNDNKSVFSIQTGPPFWYTTKGIQNSLVMRTNGTVADTFSNGEFFSIIRANIEALFGISPTAPGGILLYIGSPGHDYNWGYPFVSEQIGIFLQKHFS